MVSRTATLRLQLIDAFSKPGQGVVKTMSAIEKALNAFGKGKSPEIQKLVRQLESLKSKSGAIKAFTDGRRGLKELSQEFKLASSNVARMEAAFKAATKPTAQMKRDLDNARSSLAQTRKSFMEQGQAVRSAEKALRAYGINGREAISSSQKAIRSQIAQTIREMRRLDREARKPSPKPTRPGTIPGDRVPGYRSPGRDAADMIIGGAAANTGRSVAQRAFTEAVNFDEATAFQRALGQPDINEADIGRLNTQAKKIGGDTRFSNVDVVRAQTLVLQAGIRNADQIINLMGPITDYALAMGTSLDEAAETIRGSALSKRVNLTDAQAVTTFVDFLVKMAKNSGMTNDDVAQYMKYSGAATTTAGLPDTYSAAIGMVLRQAGLRGDEAGVFARTAAAKLVAPTSKGRTALSSMGIDYNKYVTMPDAMSVKGLETTIGTKFGKRLTADMREAIADLFENGVFTDENGNEMPIASDPGQFNAAVSDIVSPLFAGKNGKVAAADAKALAKSVDDFWKYSAQSVDVVGLLNTIMSSSPNPGALNAFFTERQGARAQILAQKWDQFQQMIDMMSHIEPGTANKIGTIANAGLYGDYTKLTGTVETSLTTIGQDWEFAIRPAINATNAVIDEFNSLSVTTRRLIEAMGAGIAILGGFVAMKSMYGLFERVAGGSAGGAAAAGGLASYFGRFGRFIPWIGAAGTGAIVGNKLGEGVAELGAVAGGKYYTPADSGEADYLRQQRDGIAAQIEKIRSESKVPAMADILIAPLQSQLDQLDARLRSFNELQIRPNIDTSSIDAALNKASALRAALAGAGGSVGTPPNNNSFGGPRASGGPVEAGKTYLVGERGPEPFIPGRSGTILPTGSLGGVRMTNHFHLHGRATEEDAMEILRQLNHLLRRSSQTSFGGLK
jgi:hypothetical protein